MPWSWGILAGLPATGPLPEQFSATGQGTHREGTVVQFTGVDTWIGNFQPGHDGLNVVVAHPNGVDVLVIAVGQGYQLNPSIRQVVSTYAMDIMWIERVAEYEMLVLSNDLWFEALGRDGVIWRTQRLSWDGMRNVRCDGDTITGDGWDVMAETWHPFKVDLIEGTAEGGAYTGPDAPQM